MSAALSTRRQPSWQMAPQILATPHQFKIKQVEAALLLMRAEGFVCEIVEVLGDERCPADADESSYYTWSHPDDDWGLESVPEPLDPLKGTMTATFDDPEPYDQMIEGEKPLAEDTEQIFAAWREREGEREESMGTVRQMSNFAESETDPCRSDTILAERDGQHGDFYEQFEVCAELFSSYLCIRVDTHDVAVLNMLQKCSRITCGDPKHEDHWDDIVGYAKIGKALVKGSK